MRAEDLETEDTRRFVVVRNDEEQYSIWEEGRDIPLGWTALDVAGTKDACLDYIERHWTDIRPRSVREALAARRPSPPAQ